VTHETDRLSAYLDRELPAVERGAVEAHLRDCADCTRHLAELAAVDAAARDLPTAEPPAGYFEAFPARVRQRLGTRPRTLSRRPPWLLALAAGLLVAVLAPAVWRNGPWNGRSASPARSGSADVARDITAQSADAPRPSAEAARSLAPAAAEPKLAFDEQRQRLKALGYTSAQDAQSERHDVQVQKKMSSKQERSDAKPRGASSGFVAAPTSNPLSGAPVEPGSASPASSRPAAPPPAAMADAVEQRAPERLGQLQKDQRKERTAGGAGSPDSGLASGAPPQLAASVGEDQHTREGTPASGATPPGAVAEEAVATREVDKVESYGNRAAEGAPQDSAAMAAAARKRGRQRQTAAVSVTGATREGTVLSVAQERFEELLGRTFKDADEARSLREAWRAFASDFPEGPGSDEARVRIVETGAAAFRFGGDREDLLLLRRDAADYLKRPSAHQSKRVREVLESLP
jgi:Putative zinc-finger